ncbi:hypothetical protein U27_04907 [Candidatus Vecturithrix granuli]|uniref:Uncharacterized protein n=1 Tax=Vecturithrix granuli TaxID=1499967 RepID=A0A081C030_VECG1|nr:hypothetical protein U27_04907 [Candidatus Vecturithrix granuli]
MSGTLTRSNEHTMYRESPVSRLLAMRETGVSRYIFIGGVPVCHSIARYT